MIIILIRTSMLNRGVMEIIIVVIITRMDNHPSEGRGRTNQNNCFVGALSNAIVTHRLLDVKRFFVGN